MSLFAPPELPPEAHTFDATTFGNYTPRGYDPCRIASRIRGIEIKYLTAEPSEWRVVQGNQAVMFAFNNKHGQVIGYSYLPSEAVARELPPEQRRLTFRPATQVPRACA